MSRDSGICPGRDRQGNIAGCPFHELTFASLIQRERSGVLSFYIGTNLRETKYDSCLGCSKCLFCPVPLSGFGFVLPFTMKESGHKVARLMSHSHEHDENWLAAS